MKQSGTNGQLTERQAQIILRQAELEERSLLMQPLREAERPPFQIKELKRNTLGLCGKKREVSESELARALVNAQFSPPIGKPQEEAAPYIRGHCGVHYHYEDKMIYWRQTKEDPVKYVITVDYVKKK